MIRLPERPVLVVLQLGFVGDSLMTLPTLAALREAHPRARIVRVINAAMSEFWQDCPYCDELLPFDRNAPKFAAGRELLEELRALKPDALVNLHTPDVGRPARYYWRDAVFAWRTGARSRLAWSQGLEALLLTHPLPRSRFGDANMSIEMFRVAEPLADKPVLDGLTFWHRDEHRREAEAQLAELGAQSETFHAVSPFGKDPAKELVPEQLGELLARCHEASGLPAVLLGGPADVGKVAELRPQLRSPVLDLVGQNGLKVAAAILERARGVLAVDSGLMHLAALLGAPTVALFGPMPVHRWRPFREERMTVLAGRTRGMSSDSDREEFDLAAVASALCGASEGES